MGDDGSGRGSCRGCISRPAGPVPAWPADQARYTEIAAQGPRSFQSESEAAVMPAAGATSASRPDGGRRCMESAFVTDDGPGKITYLESVAEEGELELGGATLALQSGQVGWRRSQRARLPAWNSCPHCRHPGV
jgi:hypothetical protein